MKNTYYTIVAFLLIVSVTGCKKYLDVNKDPNNPTDVQESLILTPVEVYTSTQIAGGYPSVTTTYWMQQLSLNQESPDIDTYRITPADVNNTWAFDLYPSIFNNLKTMIAKADKNGNSTYSGIGKVLFAYNLAICTDLYGDIPYSEALQGLAVSKPAYDSQESIYKTVQTMLDQGIANLNAPGGKSVGGDDFIYQGNVAAWKKFAYTLKARYYLRLSKVTTAGYSASAQADLALTALQNGFSSNADNATVSYAGTASAENPWYVGTEPGAGGVVLSATLINSLKANNDPRLSIIAQPGSAGDYVGRVNGTAIAADPTVYATVGTFFGGYIDGVNITGASAPVFLATYAESLFIKAEATLIKSGAAAATPIFQSAIAANMDLLGVSSANKTAYIAAHGALDPVTPLKTLIGEKYISSFLSLEAYNDWRRTGYPSLAVVPNAFAPYIPVRFPYPSQEITSNPQPQQSIPLSTPVWWAQ